MTWLYLLKHKSKVANCFLDFSNLIERQFGKKIKVLRSDNGGEFVNNFLGSFFKNNGIIHETSCAGTPQQNGVAERKNRHILEIARSLLFEKNVPQIFWNHAISTAVYLMNRMSSSTLNFRTPLQKLSSFVRIPSALNLAPKVFGCTTYVHVPR
jgi:transposase InsO family protein